MGPLGIEDMSKLQNNTVKAESDLREKYHMKLSLKKSVWYALLCANVFYLLLLKINMMWLV